MGLGEFTERVRSGAHLAESEAQQALQLILADETSDESIAAFLTALAEKGESPQEIVGFARVMRAQGLQVRGKRDRCIDTAGTGGGSETFNISTAAAFVIAGAGLPVAKHGNRALTSRCGSADVLAELGVRIERPPEVAERSLEEIGLAFMFAPVFHPAMKRVARVRRALRHRTIFNLLGPLTNPSGAPYQIIGVYEEGLTRKLAEALVGLGCRRGWVVHGGDGLDEISTGSPTRISDAFQGTVRDFQLQPGDYGFSPPAAGSLQGGSAAQNAEMLRGILEGQRRGAERDVVVLNAAAALHVAGMGTLAETIQQAGESIDSGRAAEKLSQLVHIYGEGD